MVNSKQTNNLGEINAEYVEESAVMETGPSGGLSFSELYEQSLQEVLLGEVVVGRVVQINNDLVMVDVGHKSEGQIRASELMDDKGNLTVSVGDMIEVLVDHKDEDYNLILSRDKAAKMRVWNDIKAACENKETIQGTILERVKGGFTVDIGITAFLPGSQMDIRPIKDMNACVGKTYAFNILSYDRKRNNVVLSRRAILEKERELERKKILETVEEGKAVEGIVKNITEYGVFVDLGGIDGLLHVTDITWGKLSRPSEHFKKGDQITLKVLSFDREKGRISLGLKQMKDNPWDRITEKYAINTIVPGRVVSLTDYGAFVELEEGVEGLIHISEMFWTTKKFRHPSKVLSIGDTINVMILEINKESKRISLGLKQTVANPWVELKEKYPEGTIVKGTVRNVADFGIFIGIEDGIDGLVHVSDISWKQRIKHPSEFYKKGQEVEAVVLGVDVENEKFSLGIKQLEGNPWEALMSKFGTGSVVNGKITNITEFGIFVEIEEGIEGLVHVSEVGHKKTKSVSELFHIGDSVSALVKSVDPKSRKIRLSIKDYEAMVNEPAANQYLNNKEKVGSSLGKALANLKISEI